MGSVKGITCKVYVQRADREGGLGDALAGTADFRRGQ
jgi:hypothetical protein